MPPKKKVSKEIIVDIDKLRKELKDSNIIDLDGTYEYFLTGNPIFDAFVGSGGLPKYQLEYIWAGASIGKSTLAIQILSSYLKQDTNCIVVYLDSEESITGHRLKMLGVDPDKVILLNPESIESVGVLINKLSTIYEDVDMFIIWDTLIQTPPKEQLEGYAKIGMQARAFSDLFKMVKFYDSKLTMFALNQHRENMQGQYMPPDPPGGNATKHKSFLTLFGTAKKCELIDPSVGKIITLQSIKSKIISPKRKFEHVMTHVYGYDSILTAINYLRELKLLGKKGGGYYYFLDDEENKYRLNKLYNFFTTDESVNRWKLVINEIYNNLYPDDDKEMIEEAKERIFSYYFEGDKIDVSKFTSLSKNFIDKDVITLDDKLTDKITDTVDKIIKPKTKGK